MGPLVWGNQQSFIFGIVETFQLRDVVEISVVDVVAVSTAAVVPAAVVVFNQCQFNSNVPVGLDVGFVYLRHSHLGKMD